MATVQEEAKKAIDAVFSDTSVAAGMTAMLLTGLIDHIQGCLKALDEDTDEAEE